MRSAFRLARPAPSKKGTASGWSISATEGGLAPARKKRLGSRTNLKASAPTKHATSSPRKRILNTFPSSDAQRTKKPSGLARKANVLPTTGSERTVGMVRRFGVIGFECRAMLHERRRPSSEAAPRKPRHQRSRESLARSLTRARGGRESRLRVEL